MSFKQSFQDSVTEGTMAKQPMLKFINIERDMPQKREADVRREDFDEIYAEFAKAKAEEQSSR